MAETPEAVVRGFLAMWDDPQPEEFRRLFADDAVWVDGPNGIHRGATAIVQELTRQLSAFPGAWVEIDALVAAGGTVMVEWHGGFNAGGTTIDTKVMATFEVNTAGQIKQMREYFDMNSLTKQLAAAGIQLPS